MKLGRIAKGILICLFALFVPWLTKDLNDGDLFQFIYQGYLLGIFALASLDYFENKRLEKSVKRAAILSFVLALFSLALVTHDIPFLSISAGFLLATLALAYFLAVFFQVIDAARQDAFIAKSEGKEMTSESGIIYRKDALSEPLQEISSALSIGHRGLLDAYKVFKSRIKDRNLMGVLRIESEMLSQLFIEMESIAKPIDDELREQDEYMQERIFRSKESEDFQKELIIEKLDQLGRAFSLRREILQEIAKVLEKYGGA